MEDEIKVGDVVWPKGGGALMRVVAVNEHDAVCEWVTSADTPAPTPTRARDHAALLRELAGTLGPLIDPTLRDAAAHIGRLEDALYEVTVEATVCNEGYDSLAMRAYADALRLLAECGRVEIVSDRGRRVLAREVDRD